MTTRLPCNVVAAIRGPLAVVPSVAPVPVT